eukprot:TRINITY_DN15025_c0_g1_i1.p4 TRINITY_DN15025_c0_g1~~TRINITY_DN15025_c0_g1_i1.p4  ORF type:complete len:123 (-),score=18.94 TRINITY_DN15025_c0_g1_i1:38-406(-)
MEQLETQLEKHLTQLQENDKVETVEEQLSELSDELGAEPALLEKIAKLQEQVQKLEQQKQLLQKLGRESIAPSDNDCYRCSQGQLLTLKAVSYTHLTLPTICSVQISVVAVSLKKKKKRQKR